MSLMGLCENSEIQIACRNSVLVLLILEINCTDGLCREKAIENIFLLVLGFRAFSHSPGQKRKYRRFQVISALPHKADIKCRHCDVRFVP